MCPRWKRGTHGSFLRRERMELIDHIQLGSLAEVFTSKNDLVGKGSMNPNSAIVVRLLTRRPDEEMARIFSRRG
jgi:23S rRNA G2069 N7-methylase RlmK/C1962 C5-methylase RlmI